MAKPTGFMEYERQNPPKRPVQERLKDYREIEQLMSPEDLHRQAARCMDCGVPFCHAIGCPLGNLIPEFNDMVYRGLWRRALDILHQTNNFPEITGRICPAPCETSCTLNIDNNPVTIRYIEQRIVEEGWEKGWIKPQKAARKTGFKVAVIGSGPAGMSAAQQLARAGHDVTVYEQANRIGGILRYGIPDFKLEKHLIDRRVKQMEAEGVVFQTDVHIGTDMAIDYLRRGFDALVITTGSREPRDLDIPGRSLHGIHFAMDYLTQQNRRNAGDTIPDDEAILAQGRNVVVIGGGDTGSDCIGTARRQGAHTITQIELLPKPPERRDQMANPWPDWPTILRTSSSHEEGCERLWSILTKEFSDDGKGRVGALKCVELDWARDEKTGRMGFTEIEGSEFDIQAELVLLAMGFVHTEHGPLVEDLELERDERGNIKVDANHMTSANGVFSAGDSVKGASLVVHAFAMGREVADAVGRYLRDSDEAR